MSLTVPTTGGVGVGATSPDYSLQFPDIASKIARENSYGHPFQFLLDMGKKEKPTVNEKFQVLYDTLAEVQVTQTGTGSPTTTAITATYSSTYDVLFQKGSLFRVVGGNNNGQIGLVTTAGSSGSVTLNQIDDAGDGAVDNWAGAFANGDKLIHIGYAYSEESADTNDVSQSVSVIYNYIQDMRESYSVTDRAKATKMYFGEQEWDFQTRKALERLTHKKELALLFGTRYRSNAATYSRTATGGIIYNIKNLGSGTITLTNANFTESTILGTTSKTAFSTSDFSSTTGTRWLLMSGKFKSKMFQIFRDSIVPNDMGMKKFGVDVQEIQADFGTWKLIYHPLLDYLENATATQNGVALSLDMDNIAIRYLQNNGVDLKYQVRQNIQDNAATIQRDQLRTVFGLETNLLGNHKIIEVGA